MLELTALEEVAAAYAIGDVPGVGIVGNGLELRGGFWREALIGIDHKEPGIFELNLANTPGAMGCFVSTKCNSRVLPWPLNYSCTSGSSK